MVNKLLFNKEDSKFVKRIFRNIASFNILSNIISLNSRTKIVKNYYDCLELLTKSIQLMIDFFKFEEKMKEEDEWDTYTRLKFETNLGIVLSEASKPLTTPKGISASPEKWLFYAYEDFHNLRYFFNGLVSQPFFSIFSCKRENYKKELFYLLSVNANIMSATIQLTSNKLKIRENLNNSVSSDYSKHRFLRKIDVSDVKEKEPEEDILKKEMQELEELDDL